MFVSAVDQPGNVRNVLFALKTVAKHIGFIGNFAFSFHFFNNVYIKSRRGFNMDIILEGFVQYMFKMRTFCTVAIMVFTFILVLFNCLCKPTFCTIDIVGYLWQIGKFQWSSIILNKLHQINVMKLQMFVFQLELILRKIESLIY